MLYLGAASGTSVSHVADIVGPTGRVYAVEFSHRSGRDLITMATHRTNVIPIIEDARHPLRYRMLVGMVDVVFADVAQPDQARIVGLNAHLFLKVDGGVLVSIKANCIDSTAKPEVVFANEVKKMREERIKPKEQLTLGKFNEVCHRKRVQLLTVCSQSRSREITVSLRECTSEVSSLAMYYLWSPVTCVEVQRRRLWQTMLNLNGVTITTDLLLALVRQMPEQRAEEQSQDRTDTQTLEKEACAVAKQDL